MRRYTWLMTLMLLVSMSVLAACGNQPEATEEATAEATAPLELSQTFEADDMFGGTITLNYPEGWFQNNDGNGPILTNRQALLDDINQELESGDVVISVAALTAAMTSGVTGEDDSATLNNILDVFTESLTTEGGIEFSEPESLTIDGQDALRITGSGEQGDAVVYVLNADNTFVNLFGVTPEGELDANLDLIEAVAATVSYDPPGEMATEAVEIDDVVPEDIETTVEPAATEEN